MNNKICVLLLISCVASGNLLYLSGPQFFLFVIREGLDYQSFKKKNFIVNSALRFSIHEGGWMVVRISCVGGLRC